VNAPGATDPASEHQHQVNTPPRERGTVTLGPVKVNRPQLDAVDAEPEVPQAPRPRQVVEHYGQALGWYLTVDAQRAGDVESVDDVVSQRPLVPASRRLPWVFGVVAQGPDELDPRAGHVTAGDGVGRRVEPTAGFDELEHEAGRRIPEGHRDVGHDVSDGPALTQRWR
jgi:hypothetical protein